MRNPSHAPRSARKNATGAPSSPRSSQDSRFLKGSLLERERVCGKPNCRCARGQKHRSLYLVLSRGKRQRQLYVPKDWEQSVRQWVANYHRIRDLLAHVSDLYWNKVQRRER